MSDPRWIEIARAQVGELHDPDAPRLAREVRELFPDFGDYSKDATGSTPWCGIFVAWCFAKAGIRPVSTASDLGFMWAQRWKAFGEEVTRPQVGDVLVFPHHVTFYVGEDADRYQCLGGNQSDGVTITHFRKSDCEAILRPAAASQGQINTPELIGQEVATSDWQSGKGSWYSQFSGKYEWEDKADKPNSAKLGVTDDLQGISFYDWSTGGEWFEVEAPNGVRSIEQQTDLGPNPRTGKKIDISAAAAERFGYTPRNFPTGEVFRWRRISDPPSVASLPKKEQARMYAAMRGQPATPTAPEKENPPMPSPAPAPAPARPPLLDDATKAELAAMAGEAAKAALTAALAAVKSNPALPTLIIKAIGVAFPQLGIIGVVAGYVLPLLFPHVVTPDVASAVTVGGGGLLASSFLGPARDLLRGIASRFKS